MCVTSFIGGNGSFAEECLAAADGAFPVPDGLTDAEAAGFWIPHLTGWIGLVDRGRLAAGDWLAVLGAAGGSGIAAVQLGHALGARVVAIVSDDERAAFCRELGADATINHRDGPLAPALRELTGGRGVDLLYDPVGGALAEDAAGALAAPRATARRRVRQRAVAGDLATHDLVDHEHVARRRVRGRVLARRARRHPRAASPASWRDGRLRNAVTAEVPFDELPAALQRMADRGVVGKLVMVEAASARRWGSREEPA